jgi:acyl-coenzyme A thioesterase PaaI-like protein
VNAPILTPDKPVRSGAAGSPAAPASPIHPETQEDREAMQAFPTSTSPQSAAPAAKPRRTLMDKVEAYVSRLSTRNNFWHRVCSLIWLPYAFRSGIKMKRIDASTFAAILPFRRFNRNWYNAMAGAALLANSEIAGGMYVFGLCGGDYTVVCKHLDYKFLRPCFGPALYRIKPQADVQALVASGGEFNIAIDLDILQQLHKPGGKEKRVGKCTATFHVTPKAYHKNKRVRDEASGTDA